MKNMRRGVPNLFKQGTKHLTGIADAVVRNIEACKELSKMTRTSLGPNGMNKMVINHLDRLFVTSDASTILKETDVVHPAAKIMVMASNQQDYECGDGSNFVIVLSGELLLQAESLLRSGLHPADIIRGYAIAGQYIQDIIDTLTVATIDDVNSADSLSKSIYSAICAKQYGNEKFLSKLIAEASCAVMPKNQRNFHVDNVRVCKVLGGSLQQSEVIRGVIVARPAEGRIHSVKSANIAVFMESLDSSSTETKGTVKLTSARELLDYNLGEEQHIERCIRHIADCGANVIVTGGKISEMALHFLEKFGIMSIKVLSKFELRRLARSLGARLNLSMAGLTVDDLGHCSHVYSREVGSRHVVVFENDAREGLSTPISSILLRGSTENYLNDFERAINDGVNVVRAVCRDGRFVPGAGAIEIALATKLAEYADRCTGLEQYAVKKFASALEVFPRTLASNAGLDSTEIVSKMYAAHAQGQSNVGVDIEGKSGVDDVVQRGVIDHLLTKKHSLELATTTACTILRVDQIIMAKPAGGPKAPKQQGHWDEED